MLEGKVALVTGAGRGRGLGRAHALASPLRARIVVNDLGATTAGDGLDMDPARQVVAEIEAAGGVALPDTSDVSSWSGAATLVDRTIEHFGQLDILVNNAGISHPTAFGELTEQIWNRMIDVNARSVGALIDATARHWRKEGP